MRFRPCIDIHNGCVKQIVGGSLKDAGDKAKENFSADVDADYFAKLYQRKGLSGGHVILLNPASSPYYAETKRQALLALAAYPGGLQVGGGINEENALEYLNAGASHVIVTSYVFKDGQIRWDHLRELSSLVGKDRLVVDLSCRKKDGCYYIVTDRWQTYTEVVLDAVVLKEIAAYCDEFLIHGVDVEGKASGIDEELAKILALYTADERAIPITYAGGIASMKDIENLKKITHGKIDFTIGSALDLFGGPLPFEEVAAIS